MTLDRRRLLLAATLTSFTACATAPAPVFDDALSTSIVEARVDPSLWNLQSPREVGFVELTVSATEEGQPRLVVQRMARQPPPDPIASVSSQRPLWDGDGFVIAGLRRRGDHRLGGELSAFHRAPSSARAQLVRDEGLVFTFERSDAGWAGVWIHLFDDRVHPTERLYLDVTEASHLVFDAKLEATAPAVTLRVADRDLEILEDAAAIGSLASFIQGDADQPGWKAVRVPVAAIPSGLDRQLLASLVFLVDEPAQGRLAIRNLGLVRANAEAPRAPPVAQVGALDRPAADESCQRPCSYSPRARPGAAPVSSRRMIRGLPRRPDQLAARPRAPRALWLWVAEEVAKSPSETAALLDLAERHHLTHVYMQVPRSGLSATSVEKLEALTPLIRALRRQGVVTDALDGHPAFVRRPHHDAVIGTVEAVAAYNRRAPADARFVGVRFDNEPYLLDGFFGPEREQILIEYVELMERLRPLTQSAGLLLGVDIPFWFDGRDRRFEAATPFGGRPFSEVLIDLTDNVTIMDYRTMADGPDGAIAHAEDELRYASRVGKKVALGLETVFLPDERILEFGPSGRGERLAVLPGDDGGLRLVWFGPGSGEALGAFMLNHPNARLLGAMHVAHAPASKLTFHGQTTHDLFDLIDQIEVEVSSQPSFGGFAIHSFRGLKELDARTRELEAAQKKVMPEVKASPQSAASKRSPASPGASRPSGKKSNPS